MKKYIIFDFDGTIACTNDIILDSWKDTFRHYLGWVPPDREIEATFGETLKHTIATYFPDQTYEEVRDHYRAYQEAHCAGRVYIFDGVRELIEELRSRGCRIGVATSRTSYSFWNYMKEFGMEDYVDEVVTMEDVTSHKPDPESITAVLAKLAAAEGNTEVQRDDIPEEMLEASIMIGDTKYDIGCANNAGVDSILVGWSHYVDEDDMAAGGFCPTYRIDKPADLLGII